MPRRIRKIHRIARAIPIRIQTALPKRTPTVRAMKTHQSRVVDAIAIAQEIPVQCLAKLAIESQSRVHLMFGGLKTIGAVGHAIDAVATDIGERRVFLIGGQQDGALLTRVVGDIGI